MSAPVRATSYVYFVRAYQADCTKIGCSTDPEKRLRVLQNATPLKLEIVARAKGSLHQEKLIHRRFSRSRRWGEWFRNTPDLLAFSRLISETGVLPEDILHCNPEAEELSHFERLRKRRRNGKAKA